MGISKRDKREGKEKEKRRLKKDVDEEGKEET